MKYAEGSPFARVGDELELVRDPTNEHDPCATGVYLPDGKKLGFVPKPYTSMVARLIDGGAALNARIVRRLGHEGTYGRWVFRIERADVMDRRPTRAPAS